MKKHSKFIVAGLLIALIVPSISQARRAADDSITHVRNGRGADDNQVNHDGRGRGGRTNEQSGLIGQNKAGRVGEDKYRHGADDQAGHIRHGADVDDE